MDRRVLATVGLVVLVVLAGCEGPPTDVSPDVDRVEWDGDAYQVQVTVNPNLGDDDGNISDVSVSGYSLDGERVCSATFGEVADQETRTLECETFPSLLVADTPDRSDPDIETTASLYRGHANGSHHFEFADAVYERDPGFNITDGRAVPTDGTLQTMQCRQWRHHRDGRNFSALEDAPWLEWEIREAGTDRSYRIVLSNYSRHAERGETDRFDLDPEGNTYAESELPQRLRLTIQIDDYNRAPADTGRFHDVVDGITRAEVNASENLTAAMRGIDGRYGTYGDRQVNCGPTPPQQSGHRGEYVETYAAYGGTIYHVRLETEVTLRGNAFENVTAP